MTNDYYIEIDDQCKTFRSFIDQHKILNFVITCEAVNEVVVNIQSIECFDGTSFDTDYQSSAYIIRCPKDVSENLMKGLNSGIKFEETGGPEDYIYDYRLYTVIQLEIVFEGCFVQSAQLPSRLEPYRFFVIFKEDNFVRDLSTSFFPRRCLIIPKHPGEIVKDDLMEQKRKEQADYDYYEDIYKKDDSWMDNPEDRWNID